MEEETDNFLQEIFDNTFEETEKPFNQVFSVDNSHGEPKLSPLISSKVSGANFDRGKLVAFPTITLNGQLLHTLTDKILVGKTHKDSKVFFVTSWKDQTPKGTKD